MTASVQERQAITADVLAALAARSFTACQKRGWRTDWSARGAYLFLESAELVEALRGKGASTPSEEAADVLNVLLSIVGAFNLNVFDILSHLSRKLDGIEAGAVGVGPEKEPEASHG